MVKIKMIIYTMKKLTFISLLLTFFSIFTFFKTSAQNQTDETGIFLDTLKVGGMEMRLAITISKDENGVYSSTVNSIDQGSGEIPFEETTITGNHILVTSQRGIQIEGDFNTGKTEIAAEFRQGPGKFPLVFNRIEVLPVNCHAQEPKKPYPYNEEEVFFQNQKAGVQLAGTLTFPKGEGPFPAVILITGSGPQNRNEEVFTHKPFLVLSDYLTNNGIAVLRYDDRGVGASTGDFGASTSGDFAEDALAALNFMKTRKEINPAMIGLIGHSEGGMIAPIAASNSGDVAFIVLLAGPGSNLGDNVNYQRGLMAKKEGATEEYLTAQENWLKAVNETVRKDIPGEQIQSEIQKIYAAYDEATKNTLNWNEDRINQMAKLVSGQWWRYGFRYEPEKTIQSLDCPVLALLGEKDQQVPPKLNQSELQRAISNRNEKNQLVVVPGVNHMFQTCTTGDETEYSKIDETISPKAMDLIKNWILSL